jgi:hypothetical protein
MRTGRHGCDKAEARFIARRFGEIRCASVIVGNGTFTLQGASALLSDRKGDGWNGDCDNSEVFDPSGLSDRTLSFRPPAVG